MSPSFPRPVRRAAFESTLSAAQWTGTLHPDIFFKHSQCGHLLCSLEFNIHQLILSDLAASVGASKDDPADPTIDSSVDLITSNVTTRAIATDDSNEGSVNANLEQRVFMVGFSHMH
jgi:hypothetical protein